MTTNRVKYIDAAFQSRIHLAVTYAELGPPLRRQIWETFIRKLEQKVQAEILEHLDELQEWDLNGRQIRNIMRLSQALMQNARTKTGAQ